jgi:surface protein
MPYAPTRLAGVATWRINPDALVLVYDTSLEPANNTISVPLNGTVDCTIDWGDGTSSRHRTTGLVLKTYTAPGVYVVQISGTMTILDHGTSSFNNKRKLVRCLSFGNVGLTSLNQAFRSCVNLIECPAVLPAAVTNMAGAFFNATSFNHPIGGWNTAAVTSMTSMFESATAFNQPIGGWNTGAVTSMTSMFESATAFNQPIGGWNTGAVTGMNSMFRNATAFNQPIGGWNTGAVTGMFSMFRGATAFNQDISGWDIGRVTSISNMFQTATAFNQDISGWDIRRLTAMTSMFSGSAWSNANYSAALIAWNGLPDTDIDTPFAITGVSSVADGVRFAAPGHSLNIGATVTISGTTNYNGTYRVNATSFASSFDVTATFVSSETGTAQQRRRGSVQFHAGTARFSAAAAAARNTLVTTYNWAITDGGAA